MAATKEYRERVDRLKVILPPYYGVTVRREAPDIKASKMYNVLHNYTNNEAILNKLEELFIK